MAPANAQQEELGPLIFPLEQIWDLVEEWFILNLIFNFEPTRHFVIESIVYITIKMAESQS